MSKSEKMIVADLHLLQNNSYTSINNPVSKTGHYTRQKLPCIMDNSYNMTEKISR